MRFMGACVRSEELSLLSPKRIGDREGMENRTKKVVSFLAEINLVS
jgi:hypothetical protein